jgi:hypothetical protein
MRPRKPVKALVKRKPPPAPVRETAAHPPAKLAAEPPRQGTDMTDEQIEKMLKAAYT